jgi:short-subunit dehydrogenase
MKQIAVITGASSGLGKAFVEYLCGDSKIKYDEIWIIARRKYKLEALANAHKEQKFVILPLDLGNSMSYQIYQSRLEQDNLQIALLVNNAGFGKIGSVDSLDLEPQLGMLDVNIRALTAMTKISLKYLKNDTSAIINVASLAAFSPQPYFNIYAATKAYVYNFSRALNRELRDRKIKILALCPGPVDTEFFQIASSNGAPQSFKARFVKGPEDVVNKAFRDLKKGKAVSIYGTFMRIYQGMAKILPSSFIMNFMKE